MCPRKAFHSCDLALGSPCARQDAKRLIYNADVTAFAHGLMDVVTGLFFFGVIGSLIVIVLSFSEDVIELFRKD